MGYSVYMYNVPCDVSARVSMHVYVHVHALSPVSQPRYGQLTECTPTPPVLAPWRSMVVVWTPMAAMVGHVYTSAWLWGGEGGGIFLCLLGMVVCVCNFEFCHTSV